MLIHYFLGANGFRPNGTENTYSAQKSSLLSQVDTPDIYSLIEIMRSKWMSSNEGVRLNYLDRFKISCEKYFQLLRSQYSSASTTAIDPQFFQALNTFLTSILDLLSYITSSNLDLSIKIKLVLSTCVAWLIKHAQGNYCKKNYKTICTVFKNILLNGQSNNRQLAVCFRFLFL